MTNGKAKRGQLFFVLFIFEDDFPFPIGGERGGTEFGDLFQIKFRGAFGRICVEDSAELMLGGVEVAGCEGVEGVGELFAQFAGFRFLRGAGNQFVNLNRFFKSF